MPGSDARSRALRWAAHLRQQRAETLASLESGEVSLADCFSRAGDDAIGAIAIGCLLEAVPGVRKVDARRAMAAAGISGDVSLADCPVRDRSEVIEIARRLCE